MFENDKTPPNFQLRLYTLKLLLLTCIFVIASCASTRQPTIDSLPVATTSSTQPLELELCPTNVTNPPLAIDKHVQRNSRLACVNGVKLIVSPAPDACLSSGFGNRRGRSHPGIDYQSKPAGSIVAAANGVVVNVEFRAKDYGNWIIIDHGGGIYTSYAHLRKVNEKIKLGSSVERNQRIGMMGKSGDATNAIHLHFEVRKGDYDNPKKWWGLAPINPFALPDRC